jgi:hypothetical protein
MLLMTSINKPLSIEDEEELTMVLEDLPIEESDRLYQEIISRPPLPKKELERRRQGAIRLRDSLSTVPFYANRATKMEKRTGDPMAFWVDMHSSCINL